MKEVADGVYRLGSRWANFYLVTDGPEALLVDAGYPRYLAHLQRAAGALGIGLAAVRAVILTHHHIDHVGLAEAIRSEAGASILVGAGDAEIVKGERPSHPPPGFWSDAWRPSMIAYLLHSARAGGARYQPVSIVEILEHDEPLDLPGRPRIVPTPGHTEGHCAVWLRERGVLFAGDAMVNFDYVSGERGPKLHRFNENRQIAIASLQHLEGLDAEAVLFGHGDPWHGGIQSALEVAIERR